MVRLERPCWDGGTGDPARADEERDPRVRAGDGGERFPVTTQKRGLDGARAGQVLGRRPNPTDVRPHAGTRRPQRRGEGRVDTIQLARPESSVDEPGGRRQWDDEEKDGEPDESKSKPQATRMLTHKLWVANPQRTLIANVHPRWPVGMC